MASVNRQLTSPGRRDCLHGVGHGTRLGYHWTTFRSRSYSDWGIRRHFKEKVRGRKRGGGKGVEWWWWGDGGRKIDLRLPLHLRVENHFCAWGGCWWRGGWSNGHNFPWQEEGRSDTRQQTWLSQDCIVCDVCHFPGYFSWHGYRWIVLGCHCCEIITSKIVTPLLSSYIVYCVIFERKLDAHNIMSSSFLAWHNFWQSKTALQSFPVMHRKVD